MNKAMTNDLNKQLEDLKQKISGLQNVSRLINNTLSLIGDMDVKGGYAKAVAEIQDWLQGFDTQVKGQMTALQSLLPKAEEPKKVELGVAPVDAQVPQTDIVPSGETLKEAIRQVTEAEARASVEVK